MCACDYIPIPILKQICDCNHHRVIRLVNKQIIGYRGEDQVFIGCITNIQSQILIQNWVYNDTSMIFFSFFPGTGVNGMSREESFDVLVET